MKKQTTHPHPIRFRRWSRKRYAAFASLNKCVTIGQVCNSIADHSLKKQKQTGAAGCTDATTDRLEASLYPPNGGGAEIPPDPADTGLLYLTTVIYTPSEAAAVHPRHAICLPGKARHAAAFRKQRKRTNRKEAHASTRPVRFRCSLIPHNRHLSLQP